jgi:hypothetical protein
MSDPWGQPCHVSAVRVDGSMRVRPALIESLFTRILKSGNLKEIVKNADHAAETLKQLGIVKSCSVLIDTAKDAPTDIEVVLKVEQGSRIFIKAGTQWGASEGAMVS